MVMMERKRTYLVTFTAMENAELATDEQEEQYDEYCKTQFETWLTKEGLIELVSIDADTAIGPILLISCSESIAEQLKEAPNVQDIVPEDEEDQEDLGLYL